MRDENDMETKYNVNSEALSFFAIKDTIETVTNVSISSVGNQIVSYQCYFPDFYHCTVVTEIQEFKGKKIHKFCNFPSNG